MVQARQRKLLLSNVVRGETMRASNEQVSGRVASESAITQEHATTFGLATTAQLVELAHEIAEAKGRRYPV